MSATNNLIVGSPARFFRSCGITRPAVISVDQMTMFTFSTPSPLQTNFFRYTPQTPSPLRTSRNANLMPPPELPTKSSPISDTYSFSFSSPTNHENESSSAITSPLIFSPKTFRFQQRARSQSPQAILASSTALARDRRKSQFLDRIRARREDDRFAEKDDQVLRMDFVRERREWESRRAREMEDEMGDEPEEEEIEDGYEEEGLSPTEDKEIEELLSCLPEDCNGAGQEQYGQDDEGLVLEDGYYDQLFMEMEMEQTNEQAQSGLLSSQQTRPESIFSAFQLEAHQDEVMDMS